MAATTHRSWGPPPRALALAGWALVPLRAFLGFTFLFAGLQKLANPNFFNAASPSSIQAQLIASERISPLHSILGHFVSFATPIGVLIALGEVAVGLGTLLGLWTRLAALGGLVLAFTLFLTVSFHSSPYYTGADIVFVFAWMPLILAGSGGVLSLDGLIAARARKERGLGDATTVAVPFSVVQEICGHYEKGRCSARADGTCQPAGCPFLEDEAAERPAGLAGRPDEVDRRALVLGGGAVVAAGVVGLAGAGVAAGLGRAIGGAPAPTGGSTVKLGTGTTAPSTTAPTTTTTAGSTPTSGTPTTQAPTTTTGAKPAGTAIGAASDVPVGGAASFTDPSSGDPSIVLQLSSGDFVAYDAVCPHAGCTVGYSKGARLLVCPCHGSEFNPDTGAVEVGPAPRGLTALTIKEGPDGQLYVAG